MGQVGYGACKYAFVLAVGIKQPPVTAHCTFTGTLPRLVEGFDQVVFPAVLFGQGDKATNEFGFVDAARQGGFALAAFAGPAGFADQDVFIEFAAEFLAHLGNVVDGLVDPGRVVFPIRQQVDGQKVYCRCNLGVLQPELPHIGVGDGLFDLAFDLRDQLDQLGCSDFFAQQGFVADNHGADDIRVGIGVGDQCVDLFLGLYRVAANPGATHHL